MLTLALLSLALHAPQGLAMETQPQQLLETFYKSYFSYLDDSAKAGAVSPKQADSDRKKALDPYLTKGYLHRLAKREKRCAAAKEVTDECDGDVFYCAQERPEGFTVKNMLIQEKTATADVQLCFNCKQAGEENRVAKATLKVEGKHWKLDSVRCPE